MASSSRNNQFTQKAQYLCNLCDCVSIGKKGDPMVLKVFDQFPYANCYIDRIATKKAIPGTVQLRGDGNNNPYVINLFVQHYPGEPKSYPNDNIMKRLEWFNSCLDRLLDLPEINNLAFPDNIGQSHSVKYKNLLDDFRKKYYLRHHRMIQINDYYGNIMDLDEESCESSVIASPVYDVPIEVLRIDEPITANNVPAINIVRHIDIHKLCYGGGITSPPPLTKDNKSKIPIKIGIKIKRIDDESADEAVLVSNEKLTKVSTSTVVSQNNSEKNKDLQPNHLTENKITPNKISTVPLNNNPRGGWKDGTPPHDKNPSWIHSISDLALQIHSSWDPIFKDPKIIGLLHQLDIDFYKEMVAFGDHIEILPTPQELIFNAFKLCPFPPKCIITGQDPYYANINEAMGLSFSVPDGIKYPPTLENIFKELTTDIAGFKIPNSGNLTKWANQGVLLLNAALTVRYKQKESHIKLWKTFTDTILQLITQISDTPIVLMLWGSFAKGKKSQINQPQRHLILEANHPSPLGANQGNWFGCKHFSQCNDFLIKNNIQPIDWNL